MKHLRHTGLIASAFFMAPILHAATFFVTNTNDAGTGSLRQAIVDSNNSGTNDSINFTNSGIINLSSSLPTIQKSGQNLLIDASNQSISIDGASSNRILFAKAGNIEIKGLTLQNGKAVGGQGGLSGGGGGLGAGGALFVDSAAAVTLTDVVFSNNSAQGGNGGAGILSIAGGGGGGLEGDGGNSLLGSGGGGGGQELSGTDATALAGGNGGGSISGSGGVWNSINGKNGGAGSGGGGGFSTGGSGGSAGEYGGGGGGSLITISGNGGDGGFGGGGGGGGVILSTSGGDGGIGGGGGAAAEGGTMGQGTCGGGNPGNIVLAGFANGGGGGGALGGAIFVRTGGTITFKDNTVLSGDNTVVGGLGGAGSVVSGNGTAGDARGSGLFLMDNVALNIDIGSGKTVNYDGAIYGADIATCSGADGGIIKNGEGTLVLTGTNAYSGNTQINAGTVKVQADSNLGISSSELILNTGTIESSANLTLARSITVSGAASTFNTGIYDSTISGILSGSETILKSGAGKLSLSNINNTYSGNLIVNDGILSSNNGAAFASGSLTLNNSASLELDTTLTALTWSAPIQLNSTNSINIEGSNEANITSVISGPGSLSKSGTGTLTFSGPNTYSGSTTLSSGSLKFGSQNSISNSSSFIILPSTTLDLNNYDQTINNLQEFNGGSDRNISLGTATLTLNQTVDSSLSSIITGTGGLVKEGLGTLTLTSSNLYTGTTIINNGSLVTSVENALPSLSSVQIGSNGSLHINNSQTLTSLNGTGSLTLNQNLTVNGGSFSGGISGTANILAQIPSNMSIQSQIGTSGSLTVQDGTLTLSAPNAISLNQALIMGPDASVLFTNQSNQINNLQDEGSGGTRTLDFGANALATLNNTTNTLYSGTIAGSGSLDKIGTGTLTLSNVNSFTGTVNIQEGTLVAKKPNVFGSASNINVSNSAAFHLSDSAEFDFININGSINISGPSLTAHYGWINGDISGTGSLIKTNPGILYLNGTSSYAGDTIIMGGMLSGNCLSLQGNVVNNSQLEILESDSSCGTYSGNISGTGDILINNTSNHGDIKFTGNNTFTGKTTVNSGRFYVNGPMNTSELTVKNSATLGGNGTIRGNVIVEPGGKVSPGNSIDTLIVTGNYTQSSGTTLTIEVESTPAVDLIQISGTATINPGTTVEFIDLGGNGSFSNGQQLTFMTANAGITGSFDTIKPSELRGFLVQVETVNAGKDMILKLRRAPFSNFLSSGNAGRIANYVDILEQSGINNIDLSSILDEIASLNRPEMAKAFESLSPDRIACSALNLFNTVNSYNDYIIKHNKIKGINNICNIEKHQLWSAGGLLLQNYKSTNEHFGRKSSTLNSMIGYDYLVNTNLCLRSGIACGIFRGETKWKNFGGQMNDEGLSLHLYSTTSSEIFFLNSALNFNYARNSSNRNIIFGQQNRRAHQEHNLLGTGISIAPSLDIPLKWINGNIDCEFNYNHVYENSFNESGAEALNVKVAKRHSDYLKTKIAFGVSKEFLTNNYRTKINFNASWLTKSTLSGTHMHGSLIDTTQTFSVKTGNNSTIHYLRSDVDFFVNINNATYLTAGYSNELALNGNGIEHYVRLNFGKRL